LSRISAHKNHCDESIISPASAFCCNGLRGARVNRRSRQARQYCSDLHSPLFFRVRRANSEYDRISPTGGLVWSGSIAIGAIWTPMPRKKRKNVRQKAAPARSR
jgi:hypothetical protein